MARAVASLVPLLLLAAGCTPEPAFVPPPRATRRSWVLPPPPPAPRPLSVEERRALEAEWPPVWFAAEQDLLAERRVVLPRVRLVHPPVGSAPLRAAVLQARGRPEAVILRVTRDGAGRCDPRPCDSTPPACDARPNLRQEKLGGCAESTWPHPHPPGR